MRDTPFATLHPPLSPSLQMFLLGVGVDKDCDTASRFLQRVAQRSST